jgi:hypothetical protein
MLPVILQHVRELAEVHVGALERDRNKIITPFPPIGPDFPEVQADDLEFRDVPPDAVSASQDTLRAHDFFSRTDSLYYDYSYGIKSEEFRLSKVCENYFGGARGSDGDTGFETSLTRMRDAFERRYNRQTSGDLGNLPFKYTSPSPIAWNPEPVVLGAAEIERLKQKAVAVYEDLRDDGSVDFLNSLIDEVKASNYSSISYEFGFFDVVREWVDPGLFENPHWAFPSGTRTLYGEGNPTFADNTVKLCYAQRFYVIRNNRATEPPGPPPPPPPEVRDHRRILMDRRVLLGRTAAVRVAGGPAAAVAVRDVAPDALRRRAVRNTLIHRKVASFAALPTAVATFHTTVATAEVAPPPRAGFVWVPATGATPGHWERERARGPHPEPDPPPPVKPGYRIAALKCRLLAQTP